MRTTTIGGTERRIDANPFTIIVYERAFGVDHKLQNDITTLLNTSFGPMTVLPLDAIMRLEYALERSVTSIAFPDYDHWIRSFPIEELDQQKAQEVGGWVNNLLDEVVQTFFPKLAPKTDVDAEAAGDGEGASAGTGGEDGPAATVEGS